MQLPRREDFTNGRAWQDANVAYVSRAQIEYCEARQRERDALEDEWMVQPDEMSADGLEDLL